MNRVEILEEGVGPQLVGPTYSCCWTNLTLVR